LLVALALFVGVCVGMEAIASGFYGSMTEVAVGQVLGEAQVHAPSHLPSRDPSDRLEHADALTAAFAEVEGVALAASRVRAPAMLSREGEARSVDLVGASPAEARFGSIPERVAEGSFLAEGDLGVVVIGKGLARTLEVGIGDELQLQAGTSEPRSYAVKGIFSSGSRMLDAHLVYAPIADVREHLHLAPTDATEIAIRTVHNADIDEVAEALAERCPSARCEVQTWSSLEPALAASMTTDHNFLRATFAVLIMVAGIMVLNLQLMSVLERTRELGMMLAIGASPRRLFSMLVAEAVALGLIGVSAGLALGLLVVLALSGGIDIAAIAGGQTEIGGFAFTPRIYPHLDATVALTMALGALGVLVIAAVIPALRLFSMSPLAALRSPGGS